MHWTRPAQPRITRVYLWSCAHAYKDGPKGALARGAVDDHPFDGALLCFPLGAALRLRSHGAECSRSTHGAHGALTGRSRSSRSAQGAHGAHGALTELTERTWSWRREAPTRSAANIQFLQPAGSLRRTRVIDRQRARGARDAKTGRVPRGGLTPTGRHSERQKTLRARPAVELRPAYSPNFNGATVHSTNLPARLTVPARRL